MDLRRTRGNHKVAPQAAVPATSIVRLKSTPSGHSLRYRLAIRHRRSTRDTLLRAGAGLRLSSYVGILKLASPNLTYQLIKGVLVSNLSYS